MIVQVIKMRLRANHKSEHSEADEILTEWTEEEETKGERRKQGHFQWRRG